MTTSLRLALATLAATFSPLVFAHASLVDSFPAKGQTLSGSPSEVNVPQSPGTDVAPAPGPARATTKGK